MSSSDEESIVNNDEGMDDVVEDEQEQEQEGDADQNHSTATSEDENVSQHDARSLVASEIGSPAQAASPAGNEIESPAQVRSPEASDMGSPAQAQSPAGSGVESPAQDDLFGDADDIRTSSSDEGEQREHPAGSEDEEAEEGQASEPVEETILNAEIPKMNVDLGNQIHFVKFPNFLSVDPRPFDPDTFEDEVDEDDVLDEEGRSRLKLKVENTIRWRFALDEEGNLKRESNAKFVRWSDGSMSLYLGSEVFDVHTHPLQGDHHHLFIRQGTGLQGRSVFRTKLTFRPHSTDSFTHRKMTLSMADKTNKAQKMKVLPAVGKNPEALKQELIKKEEERMRASARRESQQRRMRERAHGGARALSAAFLEPDRGHDSDEGDVSISAIKNRYKSGIRDMHGPRRPYAYDDEDDGEVESGSDMDSGRKGNKHTSGSKRIIESDAESSDEGTSHGRPSTETKRRAANIIEDDDESE